MGYVPRSLILVLLCCPATAKVPKFISDCFDCHGPSGVSPDPDMPSIAGLSATYLEDTMYGYVDDTRPAKSGPYRSGDTKRPATDMKTISKGLSEQQITQLAKYFSEQKFIPAKQSFDAKRALLGKQIHQAQCAQCHEAAGSVAEDDAGILAGQWRGYLKQSFDEYRDKSRQTGKKMRRLIDKLSDKQIQALLDYYASNKP